jgi:alkaline phosphatase D
MLKIAFCSCNHPLVHPDQPGWLALAANEPDVLLLLGDNVYIENHIGELLGSQRPCFALSDLDYARRLHARYMAQWNVPQFRVALLAAKRVMGTLDDHDFLGNDTFVSPILQRKARFARLLHRQFIAACNLRPLPPVYAAFEEIFAMDDMGFDQGLGLASSWESVAQGSDVSIKIILLDNRSYRDNPFAHGLVSSAPALGAAQISWLAQELVGSQRVSIIASGSTFSAGDRAGIPGSPLEAYKREAAILRTLYRSQRHQRILHLGGDLHYNAHRLQSAEHPFAELVSSGMGSGWQPFAKQQRGNFGLLRVNAQGIRMQLLGDEDERNLDTFLLLGAPL